MARERADSGGNRRGLHAFFSGSVQGVGFRYTALTVAGRFKVSGWVRNRSDGRVELLAEGEGVEVEKFLDALEQEMSGYIARTERTWQPATGQEAGFSIQPTD